MSLIWPDSEANVVTNQARLHAFVIGVADYPHLNGGSGPMANDPLGLTQVTTPQHTAPAMAEWLMNGHSNPACQLGSLEMLVSPAVQIPVPAGGKAPADPAKMAEIKRSFAKWEKRCSSHADNIAFFYFCGHGLNKTDQFLLPEDFGDPALPNEWANCINFDWMRVGMRKCKAQTQIFFVDACRETPFGMLTQVNVGGDGLISASITDTVACSAAYYATTQGRQAYGPDNDVTYFGQAVLCCLKGVGGLKKGPKWVVDTYSLGNALGQVMAQLARRHALPLTCNPDVGGMARIHEPAAARVVAAVECSSPAANNVAEIILSRGATLIQSLLGQNKPIIEEVEAGDWTIDVRFPGGQYPVFPPQQYTFVPPVFEGVPVP